MNTGEKAYSKLKWTPEEEELLRSLKEQKNIDSWKIIANQMNQIFIDKNRSGKQCRERYMNYVRFGKGTPKMSGWTPIQDEQLFFKFMEHGAKWVQIGRQMPGRSQNCLKNRFYGAMRKIIRKINRAVKQKKMRQKKPIKTDLLIRILESSPYPKNQDVKDQIQGLQFIEQLKRQMIKIAINPQQNSSTEQIQSLINGITKFCSATKQMSQKKNFSKAKIQSEDNLSEQLVESQQFRQQESQNYRKQEMLQEEARTLVEKIQPAPKHKIVPTLILFSSLSDKFEKIVDNNPLSNSISFFRQAQYNRIYQ